MRYLLLFLFIVVKITAADTDVKQKVTIGLGPYIQSQPYEGVKDILVPSPVIFFDNGIFYMRWSRGGVYFLGQKSDTLSWGFSLTAQPRPFGYKPSDAPILAGMQERKNTLEGGLAFSASYKGKSYIEMMLLTDLLQKHDSWLFKTEIGDEYTFGAFTFYPSLIIMYQSSQFLDYYYGVKANETTSTRAKYIAGDGYEIGAQTYIKYPINKQYSFLINLRVDAISQSAKSSPIVTDNYIYSGLFSLIYTFEY